MTKKKSYSYANPHPLEDIVLRAFAESDHHDGSSLGHFFAASMWPAFAASYCIVARDVLRCMESQGKLQRDEMGWYFLVK